MPGDWEVIEDSQVTNGDWEVVEEQPKAEIITPITGRERKAAARGGAFDWLRSIKKGTEESIATGKPSFAGEFFRGAQIPLALSTGAFRLGTGALSDVALGITERRPQDIPRHLIETFTGERTAQLSDVAESLGVSKGLPSAAVGLAAEFGLTNLATMGKLGKVTFKAGKKGVKVISGGVNKVIETTKEGFKTLKGLKYTFKPLSTEKELLEKTAEKRIGQLQESAQFARYRLKDTARRIKEIFEDNLKNLENKFTETVEEGAIKFQKALPEYTKNMHQTYKTLQNEIADNFEMTRGKLTLSEINNIFLKAQKEAIEDGYDFGQGYNLINEFLEGKYRATASNLDKTFIFQEVKNDISRIFNTVNYDKYGKTADMPAHFLRKHWGNFITKETTNVYGVSDYQQLQDWYSRNIDAMKLADKIFKPKAGELYTEKGISFLKKFGMAEKPLSAQEKFLSLIEEGNELVAGTGKLSQPSRQLGAEIRQLQEANKLMKNNISQRLDKLEIKSLQLKNSIRNNYQNRIDELTVKIGERKKALLLLSIMGGAGGAIAGVKKLSSISD